MRRPGDRLRVGLSRPGKGPDGPGGHRRRKLRVGRQDSRSVVPVHHVQGYRLPAENGPVPAMGGRLCAGCDPSAQPARKLYQSSAAVRVHKKARHSRGMDAARLLGIHRHLPAFCNDRLRKMEKRLPGLSAEKAVFVGARGSQRPRVEGEKSLVYGGPAADRRHAVPVARASCRGVLFGRISAGNHTQRRRSGYFHRDGVGFSGQVCPGGEEAGAGRGLRVDRRQGAGCFSGPCPAASGGLPDRSGGNR